MDFLQNFIQPDPKTALLVIINLIIIESLLSVDNAAVLASLVMNLPKTQRKRALRIGVFFAYVFRGLALIMATQLMKLTWLKLVGGGYLVYISSQYMVEKLMKAQNQGPTKKTKRPPRMLPGLSAFWSTVVLVELMDLTFSIDNVFAAVAFTDNIYLVCTGVFIGIITMRIVAGYFVKLMELFPFLEIAAFAIVGLLGIRLCLDFLCSYFPDNLVCTLTHNPRADFYFSLCTIAAFVLPIVISLIMRKNKGKKQSH